MSYIQADNSASLVHSLLTLAVLDALESTFSVGQQQQKNILIPSLTALKKMSMRMGEGSKERLVNAYGRYSTTLPFAVLLDAVRCAA